ncbi:MAG: hypothetical protein P9L91_06585 [Candidatus Zophobacter franzmannii]|nr:hypothetical protein [Candidatus Zophobacter franzmannii]
MKKIWIVVIGILVLLGCSQKEQMPEIAFNVNQELVASTYVDSLFNFSYQPPKDWNEADELIMEKIAVQLSKSDNDLLKNLKVYIAPGELGFYAASVLMEEAVSVNDRFTADLKAKYPNVMCAEFTSSGRYIYQYMFTDNGFVNIKMLIPLAEMQTAMFDVFMTQELYKEQVHTVESVIGSIKLNI